MTAAVLALALAAAPPQPGGAAAAHFRDGTQALAAGDYAAAEKSFLAALKLEPGSVPALGNLGVVYSRTERFSDAVRTYRRAIKLAPNHPGLLLNLAIAHVKQSDYSEAKPLLLRLPRNQQTSELLATCELFTGRPRRALDYLAGLEPSPEVHFLTGTAHLHLKQPEAARRAFAALLASSSPAQARLLMGKAYADSTLFDEAIAELKQSLDLDPASLPARFELAKAQIGLRENDEAERNLRSVLAANPAHTEAAYYLGALLVLLARGEEARPFLDSVLALKPGFWAPYYYYGRLHSAEGRHKEALPYLEKAAKLGPDEMSVWYQLTRTTRALGLNARSREAQARYEALRKAGMPQEPLKPESLPPPPR